MKGINKTKLSLNFEKNSDTGQYQGKFTKFGQQGTIFEQGRYENGSKKGRWMLVTEEGIEEERIYSSSEKIVKNQYGEFTLSN